MLSFLQGIVFFVILIGVLIFVHEGGHFVFAKLFNVKIFTFSLGFGRKLIGFKKGETEYKICAVPIGGYVRMLGEDPSEKRGPEDEGRALSDKPPWQRFIIMVGGPGANLIFPFIVHFGLGLAHTEVTPAKIGYVQSGTPAASAGLETGDEIKTIDGAEVESFQHLVQLIQPLHGRPTAITFQRGEKVLSRTVTPLAKVENTFLDFTKTKGVIGIMNFEPRACLGLPGEQARQKLGMPPNSIGLESGLKTFDRIVSVDGKPMERLLDVERTIVEARGRTVEIRYRRLDKKVDPLKNKFEDLFEKEDRVANIAVPKDVKSLADLGIENASAYLLTVKEGGVGEIAGMESGSRLLSYDGVSYSLGSEFFEQIDKRRTKEVPLTWSKGDEVVTTAYKPEFIPAKKAKDLGLKQDVYDMGWRVSAPIAWIPQERIDNPNIFGTALRNSLEGTLYQMEMTGLSFVAILTGQVSCQALAGPLTIGQIAHKAGMAGPAYFFWVMAFISINLGFFNLLPIPVLDGGQIAVLAYETVARRVLSPLAKERILFVGIALVLALMVLAFWNDIQRLIFTLTESDV